ncbi:MAG: GNAT family N-acetyltransferase [Deltaproteobacteria bacterium]|nr:GNAT family N-acetyltransferase [Deltaproteobacteria bacterium]
MDASLADPWTPAVDFDSLSTRRLLLRRFVDADLEPFLAMRADPEVARYQGWQGFTRADAEAFVARCHLADPDTPGQWFQFAIELDGEFVGDCACFTPAQPPGEAELGVTLAPAHQGQGIAREALRRLMRWLIEERRKTRLRAVVDARNPSALRLFEGLGFVRHSQEEVIFKGEPCVEVTLVAEPGSST